MLRFFISRNILARVHAASVPSFPASFYQINRTMSSSGLLEGFPLKAPPIPTKQLLYADVAVTATANEFEGIYRNKQYHPRDFDAVLDRAENAGVKHVMLTGMSLSDVATNMAIAKSRLGRCHFTIGVHPYHAEEPDSDLAYYDKLRASIDEALALKPLTPLVAFGELGLDYDRLNRSPKEPQIRCFQKQLDLYVEAKYDLPLFLHCRAAFDDFVAVLRPYLDKLPKSPRHRGLVHSFVGTADQMRVLVEELGLAVSVNGFSFKDRDSLEMIRQIPLDSLQIETDAPWGDVSVNSEVGKRYGISKAASAALPVKKRDKFQQGLMVKERNESCCIDRVAFVVAGLRGESVETVAEAAWINSTVMFQLEK